MEHKKICNQQDSNKEELILITPPYLELDFDKKDLPWHIEISTECNLDFRGGKKLREEFMIQTDIDKKLVEYFSSFCDIKQMVLIHQGNQNIHHWYLSSDQIDLSVDNFIELGGISDIRAIHFELTKDENWDKIIPILKKLQYKIIGVQTILNHLQK